jgi:uncharacterized protein involved in response to NO
MWVFAYSFQIPVATAPISLFEWHAHQMIYGFSMAVIAGFLLTAVMDWTNITTLHDTPLALLFICWAIPRVLLLFGLHFIEIAALFDLLFLSGLIYGVTAPIVAVRQWRQIGILAVVLLLAAGNLCFYLDAINIYSNGAFVGIYGGLFLIVSLILIIGGRIMPAFIRNGLEHPVDVRNPFWVAALSFPILLIFSINFLFFQHRFTTGLSSTLLFVLTSYRLTCWHASGIWSKPLLWSLFSSYLFINLGFLLFALHSFTTVSPFISIHALAYGGIGLATLSMMSRVAIGHTGRNIRTPPRGTGLILGTLTLGAIIRVVFPLLTTEYYRFIVLSSQALWLAAFGGFVLLFARMLLSPRADGQVG